MDIEVYACIEVLAEFNIRISMVSTGYQPNIKAFCTPDITSCHSLAFSNGFVLPGGRRLQRFLPEW